MTPSEMRARLSLLVQSNKIEELAAECIYEKKEEIIALLIHQHHEEHVDSEGNPLRPYHPAYKQHKIYSGKSGLTDFDETGVFHATMNLTISDGWYIIDSPARTDKGQLKSEWLENWQGAPVMDLTTGNKAIAADIIRPLLQEKLNTSIFD